MKEYNHKTRRWEEKKEKVGSLKRPDTCKGKKPHEWVLLLPHHTTADHFLSKDEIAEFYKISEEVSKFSNECDEKAQKLGVIHNSFNYTRVVRYFYKCSRCGKEQYK